MKRKNLFILSGLIILCCIIFNFSCKKDDDCSECKITPDEEALVFYNKGDFAFFKNDQTNIIDTMNVTEKFHDPSSCDYPCGKVAGSVWARFGFKRVLSTFRLSKHHNVTEEIAFDLSSTYIFKLSGTTQTMTINSKSYSDIYSVKIDSNIIITRGDEQEIPWKIDYSKTKGFIRFHYTKNQTWALL